MGVHLDAADEETEDGGVEQGVADVEAAALDMGGIVRQEAPAHEKGEDADRDVDGEKPGPVGQRQDGRRYRRTGDSREGHHRRIDPDSLAEMPAGKDELGNGGIDTHDHGRTETLHGPGDGEHQQTVGEGAESRCRREHRHSRKIDLLVAVQLPERRERQQRHHDHELKRIDHPDRIRRRDAELLRYHRQGHIADIAVHHRQEDTAPDRDHGVEYRRAAQTVPLRVAGDAFPFHLTA